MRSFCNPEQTVSSLPKHPGNVSQRGMTLLSSRGSDKLRTVRDPTTKTRQNMKTSASGSLLIILNLISGPVLADWPQFRGPDGQGHSSDSVALEWNEEKNVTWKSAVPGDGLSSPVISGNRIWLTTAAKGGNSLRAICFDKASGKLVHNIEVFTPTEPGPRHRTNGFASPTPVLDAEHVYVHFGPRGTACLDSRGTVVWKNTNLKYNAFQGAASSPILHDELLILTCDGTDHQFLAALDKRTGKIRWKQNRAHLEAATKKNETRPAGVKIEKMAYSTPLIQKVNGVPQLVSSGAYHVAAYDLKTGRELWWMPYTGFSQVGRPSFGNGLFYIVGSVAQDRFCVFAVKPGEGPLKDDQLVWQKSKGIAHVPSPLLVGKEIFVIDNGGVASCIDALTGEEIWRERLGGNYDASPIEVGGRVYFCNRDGQTTVFQASREFKKLATSKLEGTFRASPAVSDGALFLRSDRHLYRIDKARN
jgi:outer membrane protein assembly factor BamB